MQVYSNDQPVEGHDYEDWGTVYYIQQYMSEAYGFDPATISFALTDMKRWKSDEIKKVAGEYLEHQHGRVQMTFAIARNEAGTQMTPREQASWPSIRDNYARRDNLLGQIDASTDWKQCRDNIVWAPV